MKEYLKTGLLVTIIFAVICLFLAMNEQLIGVNVDDFMKQHVKFIEYIRLNFFSTHDLAPQLNMNYGLGQSFVTMYYHGMYNPFILLSLILGPNVPIYYVMYFIYFLVIILTGMSMHLLSRLNQFTHFQARVLSVLTSFSGAVIFNFSWHPMYIYYFPFMILSLVTLHYLLDNKRPYLYSLSLGMVFYTNFFFAPIVSIIQFLYYAGLAKKKAKLSTKVFFNFFKAYLLGVLLGALILVPTYLFAFGGERGGALAHNSFSFAPFSRVFRDILNLPLVSGIGVVSILALIYGLLKYHKTNLFLPVLFMVTMLIFEKVVYLLNLNMYYDLKHFIYIIPILWLLLGFYIFEEENSGIKLLVSLLCLFLVLICPEDHIDNLVKLMLCFQVFLFNIMNKYMTNKGFIIFSTMLVTLMLIFTSISFTSIDEYSSITLSGKQKVKVQSLKNEHTVMPYRSNEGGINELSTISDFTPNIYTSLQNQEYLNFINDYLEIESSKPTRVTDTEVFNNYFMQNFLGIKSVESKNKNYLVENTNPMMYGVDNNYIFDINNLQNMPKNERLIAINQGVFVEEGKKEFTLQNPGKLLFKVPDGTSKVLEDGIKEYEFELPNELQKPGIYELRYTSNLTNNDKRYESISINNHVNEVKMNDFYGKNENKDITFLFDQDGSIKKLNIKTDTSDNNSEGIEYSGFKLIYYPKEYVQKEQYPVIIPEDFKIKLNHYYSMNIDMKQDGYLVTTIPFDEGFTVLVDGEKTKTEKINGSFVGAKLSEGVHKIKLEYKIPGFIQGVYIGLIALLVVLYQVMRGDLCRHKQKI